MKSRRSVIKIGSALAATNLINTINTPISSAKSAVKLSLSHKVYVKINLEVDSSASESKIRELFSILPPKSPHAGDIYVTNRNGLTSTLAQCGRILTLVKNDYPDISGFTRRIVPHVVCYRKSRAQFQSEMRLISNTGLHRAFIVRGDPPIAAYNDVWSNPEGLGGTVSEYVQNYLADDDRSLGTLDLSGAIHPELHPRSSSLEDEIACAAAKKALGFGNFITQATVNPVAFIGSYEYLNRVLRTTPFVVPLTSDSQVQRIAAMTGSKISLAHERRIRKSSSLDIQREFWQAETDELIDGLIGMSRREFHIATTGNIVEVERVISYILDQA